MLYHVAVTDVCTVCSFEYMWLCRLQDDTWDIINADQTIDDLHALLVRKSLETIESSRDKPVLPLWPELSGK